MLQQSITLAELSEILTADFRGDGNCVINGLAPIQNAKPGDITFLSNKHYRKYLSTTKAAAVILAPADAAECQANCLILDNPYAGYARVAQLFEYKPKVVLGIHPSAIIGEHCQIDPSASIAANCVISDQVKIGADVIIGANTVIGENSTIAAGTHIWPRVTLYHGVTIGKQCVIHSGVVIGSDGFGMAKEQGQWLKIPQLGGVSIGDRVEIGANTTIDRGAIDDTIIEEGVKLDNQIQVGHNVIIGKNTAIAGCTAIAGSTKIGRNCLIGGGCCIAGHITIVDDCIVTGMSGVYGSVDKPGIYSSGTGIQESRTWLKNVVKLRQLSELSRKLVKLEKQMNQLLDEPIK